MAIEFSNTTLLRNDQDQLCYQLKEGDTVSDIAKAIVAEQNPDFDGSWNAECEAVCEQILTHNGLDIGGQKGDATYLNTAEIRDMDVGSQIILGDEHEFLSAYLGDEQRADRQLSGVTQENPGVETGGISRRFRFDPTTVMAAISGGNPSTITTTSEPVAPLLDFGETTIYASDNTEAPEVPLAEQEDQPAVADASLDQSSESDYRDTWEQIMVGSERDLNILERDDMFEFEHYRKSGTSDVYLIPFQPSPDGIGVVPLNRQQVQYAMHLIDNENYISPEAILARVAAFHDIPEDPTELNDPEFDSFLASIGADGEDVVADIEQLVPQAVEQFESDPITYVSDQVTAAETVLHGAQQSFRRSSLFAPGKSITDYTLSELSAEGIVVTEPALRLAQMQQETSQLSADEILELSYDDQPKTRLFAELHQATETYVAQFRNPDQPGDAVVDADDNS